jgi:type III secretory pathway component EscV
MAGYYDFVLGFIPLALGGGSVGLTVAGVSLTTAIIVASLLAVLVIGHGMFVRTPSDAVAPTASPSAAPSTPDGPDLGTN